jgi:hypothetical protein
MKGVFTDWHTSVADRHELAAGVGTPAVMYVLHDVPAAHVLRCCCAAVLLL